jgi:mycothiol synthase
MTTQTAESATRTAPDVTIRPFEGEYEQLIAIQKAIDPDHFGTVEGWRFGDETWRHDKYFRLRLVAEAPDGQIVGYGQINHMIWQLHPDKYGMGVNVHPAHRRKGIGSALFERLVGAVKERSAIAVRTDTQESRRYAIDFLAHRGFGEIQRYWESRLEVGAFDFEAFATAEARAAENGITLTTFAAELEKNGPSEEMLRAIYEMDQAAFVDVPLPDPGTRIPWEEWHKWVMEAPNRLPDAFFLAKDRERYVGLSNMGHNPDQPGVLHQGFTGVIREYRGKGVAMALKLQTVKYARERGYREIRTGNNTRNRPMLRINEAMGFVKQPVWIEYEKAL